MKKLLFLILSLTPLLCIGQENYIQNRNKLQLGYSSLKYKSFNSVYGFGDIDTSYFHIKKVSLQYGIGISEKLEYCFQYTAFPHNIISLQQKFHILPFFLKNKKSRIDVYIPLGIDFYIKKFYITQKPKLFINTYHFGIGTSITLYNKLGIFIEGNKYGNGYYKFSPSLKFGFTYSWYKEDEL